MSTSTTIFADDLDLTACIRTNALNGKPIATLMLSTIPRAGESEASVTFHLDPLALKSLCEMHEIPLEGDIDEDL
ncbi:MAG: hypothetical protein WCS28_12140 [Thiomicrospira sp.]|jgi:hypothetical protein